jgi:Tfp pilus assembly protein PilX
MRLHNKQRRSAERGFALVTALIACVILFALAMLVIQLSTGDLRVSAKSVGDKKAASAAETGIHRAMQNFNPQNLADAAITATTLNAININGVYYLQVDATNDPNSVYTISIPTLPASGPAFVPLTGYSIGGGQSWGQRRYVVNVEGRNTAYGTQVDLQAGIGFGPIEISTMSR